ncbi:hypothetical protein GCM10022261_15950 [Brevibacterium daeguense]|uniref:Nudix hydrolase domain-containing protein n=1 Tax=Brevibacterium daeguense TaxID=909936 RepID=A0ABP8EJB9_9MICO|nr:NUDIX domain-containing protein [Brevibacterium daeguense]
MSRLEAFSADIAAWPAPGADGIALQAASAGFLERSGQAVLSRDGGPEHFTASCVVFDPDSRHVLLHHHRKADAWGQFGGHVEDRDASFRDAAHRECLEESGLSSLLWLSPVPVDIHVHELAGAFGSCAIHRDVVFAGFASRTAATAASAESHEVRWFPMHALPAEVMPDLPGRLPFLLTAAVARREQRPPRTRSR